MIKVCPAQSTSSVQNNFLDLSWQYSQKCTCFLVRDLSISISFFFFSFWLVIKKLCQPFDNSLEQRRLAYSPLSMYGIINRIQSNNPHFGVILFKKFLPLFDFLLFFFLSFVSTEKN